MWTEFNSCVCCWIYCFIIKNTAHCKKALEGFLAVQINFGIPKIPAEEKHVLKVPWSEYHICMQLMLNSKWNLCRPVNFLTTKRSPDTKMQLFLFCMKQLFFMCLLCFSAGTNGTRKATLICSRDETLCKSRLKLISACRTCFSVHMYVLWRGCCSWRCRHIKPKQGCKTLGLRYLSTRPPDTEGLLIIYFLVSQKPISRLNLNRVHNICLINYNVKSEWCKGKFALQCCW